jgi:hypothetical protein
VLLGRYPETAAALVAQHARRRGRRECSCQDSDRAALLTLLPWAAELAREEDVNENTTAVPRLAPFAIILGCSDSRMPAEILFHR